MRAMLLLLVCLAAGAQAPALPRAPSRPPSLDAVLPARGPRPIPALVFVSRHPIPGETGAVPGLGPAHRTAAPGGRLLVREPSGRLRELVPNAALYDVADPAVSFDGRRVAFAGTPAPDSAWRIYLVGLDGRGLEALTRSDPRLDALAPGRRYHDFDPCWIGERQLCFASTRHPLTAQYADVPASNLYVVDLPRPGRLADPPRRITSERNGAEEPALDPRRGEVVFARWWFNRFAPSAVGIATAPPEALPRDSVNLWETVALARDGPRLACGGLGSRRAAMSYQTAFLRDGTPVGVYAQNLGLWPRPVAFGVQRFPGRVGRAQRIAGAAIPDSARDPYADATGLAAPSACSPAALPDGRLVLSYSPGARGDFGIHVVDAAGRFPPRVLVDLPGTLELDPAPVWTRPAPASVWIPDATLAERPATLDDMDGRGTFTYRSLDVFRSARPALGAPPRSAGARLRFYAAPLLAGGATRDTAILVREAPVRADGSVDVSGLPADVPMFEQLVDAGGRVLASAHGPAHVAGSNAGAPGQVSRCVGCHFGHSAIALPRTAPGRGR